MVLADHVGKVLDGYMTWQLPVILFMAMIWSGVIIE